MTYVISDIHGCYKEFSELLEKIDFCDEDELFILGDVLDRGPAPIAVLRDIMNRANVFLINGNHEVMAQAALEGLGVEITEASIEKLSEDSLVAYLNWMQNGGNETAKQICALSAFDREDMLCYLKEASDYEIVDVDDKVYILVHAGFNNFSPDKELEDYELSDLVWERADYDKRYFKNEKITLVTGHTPTPLIREDKEPLIYEENGHLAIDCGCVFGGNLAAVCLETGEVFYVKSKNK